jgi:glycosyltransferase involved in cell wall biosynthesis
MKDNANILILSISCNSMQITLVIDYINQRIPGGPNGVAFDTVEGLKKNNKRLENEDIHIHIMSKTGTSVQSVSETDEKYGNITYEYFKKINPTSLCSDLNYYLHLKNKKNTIDLLHSHDVAGALAGSYLQIPSVLTLHGILWKEKYYTSDFSSRLAIEINIMRFRYLSSRLKKIFAISPYVIDEVDEFLQKGFTEMEVIENPVSDIFFTLDKQEEEGLIIFPGLINPRKNQKNLVKALNILKNDHVRFHCVLPGPVGDYGYLTELKQMIKQYDLEKDVTIPGPLPFEQLLELYSKASLLITTAYQETAPMIISEAMASGTPVIASNISGIPFMVAQGKSGILINPDDLTGIADQIRMLLDDNPLRKKFGEESRRIAVSRWKSEVIVNKQLDQYTSIIHKNH